MTSSNATMTPTLTDSHIKSLYPLVSNRVVSLGDMAEYLNTTPNAPRVSRDFSKPPTRVVKC